LQGGHGEQYNHASPIGLESSWFLNPDSILRPGGRSRCS
jgi:hypothetical protein